jgi:hypothetical protein
MELEIIVEAKMEDISAMSRQFQVQASAPKSGGGILGHARHLVGMALIVSGDVIAGDSALQERAHAKDHAPRPFTI